MKHKSVMYWIVCSIAGMAIIITCVFWQCIAPENWLLFWGGLTGGLATLIAIGYSIQKNWEQQSNILKQNIKIQLFDKRYSVYNALIEAKTSIERLDVIKILKEGIFEPDGFRKKIYEYNENLRGKAYLSKTVYDKNIYEKIMRLSGHYQGAFEDLLNSASKYKELFVILDEQQKDMMLTELDHYLNSDPKLDLDNMCHKLAVILSRSDPDSMRQKLADVISPPNSNAEKFIQYFNECGIMNDFDEYLKISDMDK